jgi:uncharacterized protein DUF3551
MKTATSSPVPNVMVPASSTTAMTTTQRRSRSLPDERLRSDLHAVGPADTDTPAWPDERALDSCLAQGSHRRHRLRRLTVRIFHIVGCLAAIVVILAAGARPSDAVVIYPWCADYLGRGGYGPGNCGSVSLKQCQATLAGNGGSCSPNPLYQPYPPPPTPSPPIRR